MKQDWRQVVFSYSKFFRDAFIVASVFFTLFELLVGHHWIMTALVGLSFFGAVDYKTKNV